MYYPGVDFWDGQTRDQIRLKMEAINEREERELIRSLAVMRDLKDPSEALPRWFVDPEMQKANAKIEPFDFSISAQRGMVEAVERGLIPEHVWTDQLVSIWENLLAASGDIYEWRRKEMESHKKGRARQNG